MRGPAANVLDDFATGFAAGIDAHQCGGNFPKSTDIVHEDGGCNGSDGTSARNGE
jgi:hypothetical protein